MKRGSQWGFLPRPEGWQHGDNSCLGLGWCRPYPKEKVSSLCVWWLVPGFCVWFLVPCLKGDKMEEVQGKAAETTSRMEQPVS